MTRSVPRFHGRAVRTALTLGALPIVTLATAGTAHAGGTRAGTDIENIASASYDGPSGPIAVESNSVVIKVDELLDVIVTHADPGAVAVSPGSTGGVLKFTVTNSGNGPEAFALAADTARGGDDFNPAFQRIVIDSNGNGAYDPGVDTVHVAGSNDPVLAPDASVTVFIVSDIPAGAGNGQRGEVALTATAKTGSGTPGTAFAGQGEGGGNAVVGASTASRADIGAFTVLAATAALAKTSSIVDPFGGSRSVPGSTITYKLTATVGGSGSVANLTVRDAIPAGTAYKAGSLTLGGGALTDAADGDAGKVDGAGVAVALGSVPAGQTRAVSFQVVIQ